LNRKTISFVVIAYNEERTITNCIESVLKQKGLGDLDYEVIVVNDGSEDGTGSVARSFERNDPRIRSVDLVENRGRGFARREGVRRSKGDYVALVDADVTLPENWLERVMPCLQQFDAAGGIAAPDGDCVYICQRFCLEPRPRPATFGITGNNSVYKRSVFDRIAFDPELRGGEDVDLILRMVQSGYKIKLLEDLVVDHKEDIGFGRSLKRMFSHGKGATNLLNVHKTLRASDISFSLFAFLLVGAILSSLRRKFYFVLLFFAYPLLVSYLHLLKNFRLRNVRGLVCGGVANYFMISSYFLGRLTGFFVKE
jgi:glycosyltransferase involved in cell wall biosynthesis